MQTRRDRAEGPTDEDLMQRTQGGDRNAFAELFTRYQRPIYAFVYRMIGDRGHAESLAQETFLKVLRRAGSYRYPETLTTWLYTVARNVCIDFERKKGSRFQGIPDAVTTALEAPGSANPGTGVARDEEIEALRKAIGELPDLYREVVILRVFQGLPFKDISRVVDCPESTARSRMGYALDVLRRHLAEKKA